MPVHPGTSTTRLKELGAFLRTRRERLTPEAVGLPSGVRRRTPGLRREEVAQLADVGLTWYTWLEQGRDINVSPEVLCRVSRALRMQQAERDHLFVLAGHQAPQRSTSDDVREEHRHVLQRWEPYPAYILNRRWDVLAWNRAFDAVFSDYDEAEDGMRNGLRAMFLKPSRRALTIDWQECAEKMTATFRADAAQHLDDPEFRVLIAELESASPEFAAIWQRRDVRGRTHAVKRLQHPDLGRLEFEHTAYEIGDQPGCKLVLYTPTDRRTEVVLAAIDLGAVTGRAVSASPRAAGVDERVAVPA